MKILFKVNRIYKIFARMVKIMTASVVSIFILAFLLIQIPGVQNYIGQRVLATISEDLNTQLTAHEVSFNFHEATIDQLYLQDQKGDSLFSSNELHVRFNLFPLLNQKVSINSITMSDGTIRANRKQGAEHFNYQFLLDYFAPSDTASAEGTDWTVDISTIELNNTRILHEDAVTENNFSLNTPKFLAEIDELDLEEQLLEVDQLTIAGSDISYLFNSNIKSANVEAPAEPAPASSISFPNPTGWTIGVNNININHTALAYVDAAAENTPGKLNPSDMRFEQVSFLANGLHLDNDTAYGHIESVKLREQSGFQIDTLAGNLHASAQLMKLDQLTLRTANSTIGNSLALHFNDISDFGDFVRKVKFNANFDESSLAAHDMLYFMDELNIPHETYFLDGNISGRVGDLNGDDIRLKYGKHTDFLGNFSILGLPNADESYIDFKINKLQTNYSEFNNLLPFANLPSNTRKLGVVNFNGTFNGFLRDFVAYGKLSTALGSLESDINMKFPENDKPTYSGNLKMYDFHAGKYLDDPNMGRLTFSADLNGTGLKEANMNAEADGVIKKLEYYNYAYKEIDFNGNLQQRFFSGDFQINDPNIVMDFQGTVDFKSAKPTFSVVANIENIETAKLNLTDQNIKVTTRVTADFDGITLDDVVGNLKLNNTNVYTGGSFYRVGDVIVNSENYSLGKRLSLESSIIDARLDGKFDVTVLPATLLGYLSNYYPSVLNYSSAYASGQDFMFSVDIKRTNNITDLIFGDIKGLDGSSISGNFNSSYRRLILNANIPNLKYNDTKAEAINIFVNSNDDTLYFDTNIKELAFNDQMKAAHHITGKVYNNNVFVNLRVSKDSLVDNFYANAILSNEGDSIKVKLLDDSRLLLADREWDINSSNALIFYQDLTYAKDLEFTSGDQKITVESIIETVNEEPYTGLQANLFNVNLKHVMDALGFTEYELDGTIDGKVAMHELFFDSRSLASELSVSDFSIDRDTFGVFSTEANMNFSEMILNMQAGLEGKAGTFDANGMVNMSNQNLGFNLNAQDAPFKLIEPFMTGIISETEGQINGSVDISGTLDNPSMKGNLALNNGVAKVVYLNSKYYFEPMNIDFTEKSIYIKNTAFRDGQSASASKADIGGEIFMEDFTNIEFRDFYIYTDHDFKFMETTKKDNDVFYGNAYGKGIMLINGPLSRLDVYINAVTDPGTKVSIPIAYETGVSQYDFVTFVDRDSTGKVVSDIKEEVSYSGVNFTMDLDITPDAEVQMIFDEQAGDIISGRGEGSLKINFNTDGEFEMYGGLNIHEGDYLFTLEDVINKKFSVQRGGTITWSGDPYEANLNLTANYTRKVSGYNLVSYMEEQLSTSEIQQLKNPSPFTVQLHMTGSLSSPDIAFDIEADESEESVSSIVSNRLQEIKKDQHELNKQVFGLIVFNSFLPAQMSSSQSNGALLSSGVGTVTEFVSNQLSIYFNDWLSKYDMEVDFQFRNYNIGSTGQEGIKRNELELELRKKIGRLAINVGGNFDFGNTNASISNNNNVAGDFSVEYNLTEDGRFRVKGFRNSEYDLFSDAYRNKGGIGLFYRKEFNSFKELFKAPESSKEEIETQEEERPKLEATDGPEGTN